MRIIRLLALPVLCASLAGCVSTTPQAFGPPSSATKTITWTLVTDPPGANIAIKDGNAINILGESPYDIPVGFGEEREPVLLGFTRHKKWHVFAPTGLDTHITETKEGATLHVGSFILTAPGYADENVKVWQPFSLDLKQLTDNPLQPKPASSRITERIFFQNPTESQHIFRVKITSEQEGGEIYMRNKDGSMGEKIGRLPHTETIKMAEKRHLDGRHKDWVRFHNTKDIWGHGADGYLYLTCVLVKPGYEPESIYQRRICRYDRSSVWDSTETASFRFTTPTKAEWKFTLRMDSLPSGATVYAVEDDGAIGRTLGETPLECEIGLGQSDYEEGRSGNYFHKDWHVWGSGGFIRWYTSKDNVGHINLTCALFKDGFAIEKVTHEICTLTPGKKNERSKTLTIPLPTHEQAAIREQNRLQKEVLSQQRDWDEEMARRKRQWDSELARRQRETAQQHANNPQTVVVKQDPHYGREWQTGIRALGEAIRPYSKINPGETEQRIRAAEGMGTLLDLMNR